MDTGQKCQAGAWLTCCKRDIGTARENKMKTSSPFHTGMTFVFVSFVLVLSA